MSKTWSTGRQQNRVDRKRYGLFILIISLFAVFLFCQPPQTAKANDLTFSLTDNELQQIRKLDGTSVMLKILVTEDSVTLSAQKKARYLPIEEFFREELGVEVRIEYVPSLPVDDTAVFLIDQCYLVTSKEKGELLAGIFRRYSKETDEGGRLPDKMKRSELSAKISLFEENFQEELKRLQQERPVVYWGAQFKPMPPFLETEDGTLMEQIMAYFSELSGLQFTYKQTGDVVFSLEENEIQLAVGIPKAGDDFDYSTVFGDNPLMALVLSNSGIQKAEDIPYVIWGTEDSYLPLLGEEFDNRCVGYFSIDEIQKALATGEIGGMLLRKTLYESILKKQEYRVIEGVTIANADCFAYCNSNTKLNEVMNEMLSLYLFEHTDTPFLWVRTEEAPAKPGGFLQKLSSLSERTIYIIAGGIVLILIALIIVCNIRNNRHTGN